MAGAANISRHPGRAKGSTIKRLYRQRGRWFQGNLQVLKDFGPAQRAATAWIRRLDVAISPGCRSCRSSWAWLWFWRSCWRSSSASPTSPGIPAAGGVLRAVVGGTHFPGRHGGGRGKGLGLGLDAGDCSHPLPALHVADVARWASGSGNNCAAAPPAKTERERWSHLRPDRHAASSLGAVTSGRIRNHDPYAFVPGRLPLGAATSAYQIEGSPPPTARAPPSGTRSRTPGKILTGETGDVACDHYRRWDRTSTCSPKSAAPATASRSPGHGSAQRNRSDREPGLDFYDRLVDGLVTRGIKAFPPLYHWDLPQALQDSGGWYARDTATLLRTTPGSSQSASETGRGVHHLGTNRRCIPSSATSPVCMHRGLYDLARVFAVIHHQLLAHGLASPRSGRRHRRRA